MTDEAAAGRAWQSIADGIATAANEEISKLSLRVVELEVALYPFIKWGKRLNNSGHGYPEGRWDDRYETFRMRVGDVRRCATLAAAEPKEPTDA